MISTLDQQNWRNCRVHTSLTFMKHGATKHKQWKWAKGGNLNIRDLPLTIICKEQDPLSHNLTKNPYMEEQWCVTLARNKTAFWEVLMLVLSGWSKAMWNNSAKRWAQLKTYSAIPLNSWLWTTCSSSQSSLWNCAGREEWSRASSTIQSSWRSSRISPINSFPAKKSPYQWIPISESMISALRLSTFWPMRRFWMIRSQCRLKKWLIVQSLQAITN